MGSLRDGVLKQWMGFIISLDKHYHTHLSKLLTLHEEVLSSLEESYSEAMQCSEGTELEGRGIAELINTWNQLQVHCIVRCCGPV